MAINSESPCSAGESYYPSGNKIIFSDSERIKASDSQYPVVTTTKFYCQVKLTRRDYGGKRGTEQKQTRGRKIEQLTLKEKRKKKKEKKLSRDDVFRKIKKTGTEN